MPAPRAVLIDIEKNNLDPKKEYRATDKKGNLVDVKDKKPVAEKPGLVFLEKEKSQVLAAKAQVQEQKKVEVNLPVEENKVVLSTLLQTDDSLDVKEESLQDLEVAADLKETEEKTYFSKKQKANKAFKV
jgi:hypothetical protein